MNLSHIKKVVANPPVSILLEQSRFSKVKITRGVVKIIEKWFPKRIAFKV
jgi:hypothetical protein